MAFDLLILSDIRFVREGLAEVLARDGAFRIAGVAMDVASACAFVTTVAPRIILVDTSLPDGITAVGKLRRSAPAAKIVAFALLETAAEVIAWAQAGIDGYIPRNTALNALVARLNGIVQGEQACPTQIASGMLRWIAQHAGSPAPLESVGGHTGLTTREREIADLMRAGLSNKEIARELGISLATTKSHVHNILAKLGVRRRGQAVQRLPEQHVGRKRIPPPDFRDRD